MFNWELLPSFGDYHGLIDIFILVPITIDEEPLVKEKGSNEVMHMLKSKDVVDLSREYLVEEEW